jgi:hypothetical protein
VKICAGISEAAREAASVASGIVAIDIHLELDGPEPPHDALAPVIESSRAHETDISPELARSQGRQMQVRSFEIRQSATHRHCRKGIHLLTPDNRLISGACRACDRERRRVRRNAA